MVYHHLCTTTSKLKGIFAPKVSTSAGNDDDTTVKAN
jgi:hypothetical protein